MTNTPTKQKPLRERVRSRRRIVDAEKGGLDSAQNRLIARGYQSVFCHTQGDGNIFILWLNLTSGDQLLSVSSRGPTIEGTDYRSTGLFRLLPVEAFPEEMNP